ncbi:MAG: hypothetical protein R6V56_09320 [Lentisphaeria bacterium]
MAFFNRILIVLITLMTIVAAYMSFLLFERRNDFRDRAADLSKTVKVAVSSLDKRSNTKLSKDITFNQRTEEMKEGGTLSWEAYLQRDEYNERLNEVEALAEDINSQRNYLAEQLREIALELGFPVQDLSVDDLTNVANPEVYKEATQKILRLASAQAERSDALVQNIISNANLIEADIDEASLREREVSTDADVNEVYGSFMHSQPLQKFSTAVNDLNTRCFNYGDTLASAITEISIFDWNTTASRVQDSDNYSPALTTMSNDFARINGFLVERETLIERVKQLEKDLQNSQENLEEMTAKRNKLQKEVEELQSIKDKYQKLIGGQGEADEISPDLHGEVLQYNNTWNYAIINLGGGDIFKNAELLVARDGRFIARVRVTSVTENISVAEVIPDTQQGELQKGDEILAPANVEEDTEEEGAGNSEAKG